MGEEAKVSNPWLDLWMDAQRNNWAAWTQLSKQAVQGAPSSRPIPTNWEQALDLWWKAAQPALPEQSRDLGARLFDLGKGYLRFGEQFWDALTRAQEGAGAGAGWQEVLNRGLELLRESFSQGKGAGDGGDPWSGFATFWGMPLDTWRRVCSACSIFPGDSARALRGEGAPGPTDVLHGALGPFLTAPTLGYTREWQEQLQQWGQLWLRYGDALQHYTEVLNSVGACAVELLQGKLLEMGRKGETLEGVRSAYDLWIDCGEEAYAQVAATPAFGDAQARLVNALMALKRHEQQLVEEVLTGLNMPTRSELDTTHRRVHEMRREVRAMRNVLEELEPELLRRELEELRAEIADLKKGKAEPLKPSEVASASATTAKAAPRRRRAPTTKEA